MKRATRGRVTPVDGYRSKLERDYALNLRARQRIGEIEWWGYECLRLKLGEGAWFTPDFIVMNGHGALSAHETKGFRREAAMVRLKVAASLFPWLPLFLVSRLAGGFRIEEVPVGMAPKGA